MNVSVIVVTHNPRRDLLRRTIAALAGQTKPASEWELIVVDNASSPPLTTEDLSGSSTGRLVREERLGIAYARFAGIAAARHAVSVFVDDDNLLAPDYLEQAIRFLDEHPSVGAVGGVIEPEFESIPPTWIAEHTALLAVRDLGREPIISAWSADAPREFPWCSPYGAGLVARTACLRRYRDYALGQSTISLGRIGLKKLAGSDDAEMMLKGVLEFSFQVAYAPALRLRHVIPARRLHFAYLRRLAYQTGVSWGEFCTRHGFLPSVPRWTVPLRQARAFVRCRAWTPSGFLTWCTSAGRFAGRASATAHR